MECLISYFYGMFSFARSFDVSVTSSVSGRYITQDEPSECVVTRFTSCTHIHPPEAHRDHKATQSKSHPLCRSVQTCCHISSFHGKNLLIIRRTMPGRDCAFHCLVTCLETIAPSAGTLLFSTPGAIATATLGYLRGHLVVAVDPFHIH